MSISTIKNHLSKDNSNDVVICYAKRTALCKAKKGAFKNSPPEDLLAPLLKDAYHSLKLSPENTGDIVIGNVLQMSSGHISSRVAQAIANIPMKIPLQVLNRQCSSGLQACAVVFNAIMNGE